MDFTGPHHVPVVSARATRSRVASGEAELATKSLGRTTFLAQDDFLTRTQRQATERETVHRGRVAVDRYAREAAEQTEREVVARTREILAEEAAAMERRMRGGWDGRGAQPRPTGATSVRDCECVACHRADARPAREAARARASREGNIASRAGREVHEQRRWLASHRATVERTLHSVSAHSAWLRRVWGGAGPRTTTCVGGRRPTHCTTTPRGGGLPPCWCAAPA